jgi:hypothetical protein
MSLDPPLVCASMVSTSGSRDNGATTRHLGSAIVAAARVGDAAAFTALVERYRRELQVHCYRMQPAIAIYLRRPGDTEYLPLVIEVLRSRAGGWRRSSTSAT